MRYSRTLYALAAVALATPALAADVSYRDASSEKRAATSSRSAVAEHPREASAEPDATLRCDCMPARGHGPAREQEKDQGSPHSRSHDHTDRG